MNKALLNHTFPLLHIDYVQLDDKWNYKNIVSPYHRVYFIDEGEGFITSEQQQLKLTRGHLYLIPAFTPCSLHCDATLSQYFVHFFEETRDNISLFQQNRVPMQVKASDMHQACFMRLLQINPGRGINRSHNPLVYEKNIFYREYQLLNERMTESVYMETQGILLQLISAFLQPGGFNRKVSNTIHSKVLDAIHYIQTNIDKDISVAQLASRANQHTDYFSRLFFQHTGARPVAYLNQKRIERAQYLIATTTLPLSEIAAQTGFDSITYFARMFKKVTGTTPAVYRHQHK